MHHLQDHTLGHREGAVTDLDGQEQFGDRIDRRPRPGRGTREPRDSRRLADRAGLHGAAQGTECVELHLRDAHVVEEILREGCRMLRDLNQPRQNGIGIALEAPGAGADAQAFRQRVHRPPQLLGRAALAMERRAVGLLEIALARRAGALPPGATTRMAVGTEMAQPHPPPIGTGGGRAELLRGVHRARASPAGDERQWGGRWQGIWSLGRLLTGGPGRLVEEAREGVRDAGALAWCLGSQRRCGAGGHAAIGPHDVEHETQQHKADEQQLVDKRVWHQGIAPLTYVVKRGYCTRFSGHRISRTLEGHDQRREIGCFSCSRTLRPIPSRWCRDVCSA